MSAELWKKVSLFGGRLADAYDVSNFGRIRSVVGRPFDVDLVKNWGNVTLQNSSGVKMSCRIDLLVATEFLPNPHKLCILSHKDGNPMNSRVENLEWFVPLDPLNGEGHLGLSAIRQYTSDGIYIREYASLSDAHKYAGVDMFAIEKCCLRDYQFRNAGGFKFRFAYDDDVFYLRESKTMSISKSLRQYSLGGKEIAVYQNLRRATWFLPDMKEYSAEILSCCNRKIKSVAGFVWRFVTDDEFIAGADFPVLLSDVNEQKEVRQYTLDGLFVHSYDSIEDAKSFNGFFGEGIYKCCHHKEESAYGYVWRLASDNSVKESASYVEE